MTFLLFASAACPGAVAARFIDTSGNWAETYIDILSDKGVIPAESDGRFKPDDPVSRALLADWLVKVLKLGDQPVPDKPSFPDVKTGDWFYKPVEIIRQNNYLSGYADGFRPNQFIQKGEVITIISRALNRPAPDETQIEDELDKYKDAARVPAWARAGVAEASLAGILTTGPDSLSVGAEKLATRGDCAALLYKLDEYMSRRDSAEAIRKAGIGQFKGGRELQRPGEGFLPRPASERNHQSGQVNEDYFGTESSYSVKQAQKSGSTAQPAFGAPANGSHGNALRGGVMVLAAGTRFKAELKNSINSSSTQPGEEIRAVINEAIYANGVELIPAGSRLIGTVSSVKPAARFKAGANGKMDIKFSSCETPDGRNIPLSASIEEREQHMSGGTTAGRVGKGLVTTGVGAASGAALGTALGAIVGGTAHGNVGASTGMGAVFGTAIGAGVGGVGAIVRKGSDLKIAAGSLLPLKLNESTPVPLAQPGTNKVYPRSP